MKRYLIALTLFSFLSLECGLPGTATPPNSSSKPPQKGSEKPAEKPKEIPKLIIAKDKSKEKKEVGGTPYLFPGVVTAKESGWVGSENFFNFPKDLAFEVSINTDSKEAIPLDKEFLKGKLKEILNQAYYGTEALQTEGKPPLPLLHLRVLLVPLKIPTLLGKKPKEGFIASCSLRLFEEVTLPRVILEKELTFQAITYESETLVISSKEEISKEIQESGEKMVKTFIDKVTKFNEKKG